MIVGDEVPVLEALLYMRDHEGSIFEDYKHQYTMHHGRMFSQARSDTMPFNYGGDWSNLHAQQTSFTLWYLMDPAKRMLCTKT